MDRRGKTISFSAAMAGLYWQCLFVLLFLLVGCAPTAYLIAPDREKKVLLIVEGDSTGNESTRLTKLFQDVRPVSLALNPQQYISTIKYEGAEIAGESFKELGSDDIGVVLKVANLRYDRTYDVEGCQKANWTGTFYNDIAYDDNGKFVERGERDVNKPITTCWHSLQVAPSADFVVYDTTSASKIFQGSYPPQPDAGNALSGVNQITSLLGVGVSATVSKPTVLQGRCPKFAACWRDRFYSQSKNENNPKIKEEVENVEAEATKDLMKYIAKLPK